MMTKEEFGFVVMHNGAFWGTVYEDGHETVMGWVDDPQKAKFVEVVTYPLDPRNFAWYGSRHRQELAKGKVVKVKRTITLTPEE